MNTNIIKCIKCGLQLIEEESYSHKCRKLVDYKIEGTTLWGFDGERWISRKLLSLINRKLLPTGNQQRNKTTDDETEPKIVIFKQCMRE